MIDGLSILDVIELVDLCLPIKITFNDIVLYDDDSGPGECKPPLVVIPDRIRKFKKSKVKSIHIEIVQSHHSIVTIRGEYIGE